MPTTQPPPKPAAPASSPPPARPPAAQQQQPPRPAAATYRGEAPTGRATVGPAQTYPPGSRHQEPMERNSGGPDPQDSKLRAFELGATRAQEEPVETIAQEQRARSAEYEADGVEVVKARLDERDPRDRPRTVAGVSPTQVDAA